MSALQEFMASIGIGNALLFLRMQEQSVYPGDDATAMLSLRGGEVRQLIKTLTFSLIEVRNYGKDADYRTLETFPVDRDLVVEPDEVRSYPWTFRLPEVRPIRVTTYHIRAEADILHAVNPRCGVNIGVDINREYQTIMEAMKQMGFTCTNSWQTDYHAKYHAVFMPSNGLSEQLQTAELRLGIDNDTLAGSIVLSYRGHSPQEQVKAFFGVNAQEIPLEFPRRDLVNAEKRITPEGAIPALKKALADSLILPDNEAHWMLRGSQAPPAGKEELLRPAREAGSTHSAELLRPVEGAADKE